MRPRRFFALLLLTSILVVGGCVLLPSPPIGVDEVTTQTIERLKPGETTRVDVLMTLGDPTKRLRDDRFFVYDWIEIQGVGLFSLGPAAGGAFLLGEKRRLAIEFLPEGRIARMKQFAAYSDETLATELDAWFQGTRN